MIDLRMTRNALVFIPALLLGTAAFGCGPETLDESEANVAAISARPVALQGPVIIGAGVAGARAAYELKQKGITNITLIAPAKAAPENDIPDTGLTTTVAMPNGGTLDVGASLFPDTYEILDVAKKLGLQFDELGTTLAIVRRGKPVVIDQANSLTLYKLFTPFELTPVKALKTQLELFRLQIAGYNHRDGRLYAKESRTIEQYLQEFSGNLPARYLSVIPEILGGQDVKTASAGFQQTLFTMNAPHVYTLPQMQQLPLKLIEASDAKVELARITKVDQEGSSTTIEGERASGEKVKWTTTAPVVVATPSSIASYLVQDTSAEERALLDAPMRAVHTLAIELTPGWKRPAGLNGVTYGGVPGVEVGSGWIKGWALDYRSEDGNERVAGLTLTRPAKTQADIDAAIHEASKYLPGLDTHVSLALPASNPYHAPSLTPAFYKSVDTYWKWIGAKADRRIVLAGAGINQYGMDGASFSGRLAADVVVKKLATKP